MILNWIHRYPWKPYKGLFGVFTINQDETGTDWRNNELESGLRDRFLGLVLRRRSDYVYREEFCLGDVWGDPVEVDRKGHGYVEEERPDQSSLWVKASNCNDCAYAVVGIETQILLNGCPYVSELKGSGAWTWNRREPKSGVWLDMIWVCDCLVTRYTKMPAPMAWIKRGRPKPCRLPHNIRIFSFRGSIQSLRKPISESWW